MPQSNTDFESDSVTVAADDTEYYLWMPTGVSDVTYNVRRTTQEYRCERKTKL